MPNCNCSHCICHHYILAGKRVVSLRTVLHEALKIYFIKLRTLSIGHFNIPCDKVGIMHKALLLHSKV